MLRVSLDHLQNFDDTLTQCLRKNPAKYLPSFEAAVQEVYRINYSDAQNRDDEIAGVHNVPKFQVQISSDEHPRMLRDLQSNLMGQLVVVPGIITSASKTSIRATQVTWKCSNCGHEKTVQMKFGFGGTVAPRTCENKKIQIGGGAGAPQCPLDPYRVCPDKCQFLDQQTLKLQEAPELIPTGEMPRTLILTVDRELTDKVTPGNRVKMIGILSIREKSGAGGVQSGQNMSYIRVLGIQSISDKDGNT